jgi:hypothetical protein
MPDIFQDNQEEALHKDGHQKWHRLILNDPEQMQWKAERFIKLLRLATEWGD